MSANQFNPEDCHRAFREGVAPLFAPVTDETKLDARLLFNLRLVADSGMLEPGRHLVDIGAGLCAFGPVARQLGLEVTLVDDFAGGGGVVAGHEAQEQTMLNAFEQKLGVRISRQDVLFQPLPLPDASVDIVTCFNSLEHWHHSPKRLFREIVRVLKPRGVLLIATPNAANIRKRVYAVFGENIFDRLEWWYQDGDPQFRGHVREPIVRDLKQIMHWNGFEVFAVHGRNFIGRYSKSLGFLPPRLVTALAGLADHLLRPFPTLCSDIFVVGRKTK